MTQAEISAIVIAVINAQKAAKSGVKARRKGRVYVAPKVVDETTDRVLKRRSSIGRGFNAKGIKVTFDESTGKFSNVKPYKIWLSEGRLVRRGEHGVRGLFHLSQTDAYVPAALPSSDGVVVTKLPAQTRESFEQAMA